MTTNSCTVNINTEGEFVKVSEAADFTFTNGNKYVMQVQNACQLKIADAIFYLSNEKFQYTATSDDLYIKTPYFTCTLTILEG